MKHRSRFSIAVIIIFVLALSLRLIWVFWLAESQFLEKRDVFGAGDTHFYVGVAQHIANGQGFSSDGLPTAFITPLYPLFLASIFSLFGEDILFVQIAQILLSSLTAVLIAFIARHLFGDVAGYIAGAVAGIHIYLMHWSGFILTETLFVFLLTLSVYASLHFFKHPSMKSTSMVGLLFGLTTLCRPMALGIFLILGAVWLFKGFKSSRSWLLAGVGLAAFLIVLSPWVVRNYLEFDKFIPLNAESGFVLYRGNNPNSVWLYGEPAPGEFKKPTEINTLTREEQDAYLRNLAFEFIRDNPGTFLNLSVRRLYLFWSPDFPTYSFKHNAVNALLYLPLYVFMVLGLLRLIKTQKVYQAWIFILILTAVSALHMVSIVDWDQRFRLPLQPFIVALAGGGFIYLLETVKQKRNGPV